MEPETKLFRAVINQAIEDVIEPGIQIRSFAEWVVNRRRRRDESENSERAAYANYVAVATRMNRSTDRLREAAVKWLTRGSKDFRLVCRYAGLEPEYVVMKIQSAEILNGRL